jgi:hypothetical protein
MSTFYICRNCGYPETNHNFRHTFSEIPVTRLKNPDTESFTVDANLYPVSKSTKCGKEGCNGVIGIHNTPGLEHSYIPVEYTYRTVQLVLPGDSTCNKCKVKIDKHNTVMTHHFSTKVFIHNREPNDQVLLINPEDEDRKIINS